MTLNEQHQNWLQVTGNNLCQRHRTSGYKGSKKGSTRVKSKQERPNEKE